MVKCYTTVTWLVRAADAHDCGQHTSPQPAVLPIHVRDENRQCHAAMLGHQLLIYLAALLWRLGVNVNRVQIDPLRLLLGDALAGGSN